MCTHEGKNILVDAQFAKEANHRPSFQGKESSSILATGFNTHTPREEIIMLWTIALILAVLWLAGMLTSFTMGGFIHVLLVIAVIIIIRLVQGKKVL